ncbi:MAG: hypothetical protein B7X94_06115 [Hydrogenophilales bacterium 17-62-8]|nr:MAG: hypothetical protein B7X94_06115 [Hydrogenophilales bacterium 17-62-8]
MQQPHSFKVADYTCPLRRVGRSSRQDLLLANAPKTITPNEERLSQAENLRCGPQVTSPSPRE